MITIEYPFYPQDRNGKVRQYQTPGKITITEVTTDNAVDKITEAMVCKGMIEDTMHNVSPDFYDTHVLISQQTPDKSNFTESLRTSDNKGGSGRERQTTDRRQEFTIKDPDAPITEKQHSMILDMTNPSSSRFSKMDKGSAEKVAEERWEIVTNFQKDNNVHGVAHLTKGQASKLIDKLING